MSDLTPPTHPIEDRQSDTPAEPSFSELLSNFEQHAQPVADRQVEGIVVAITAEAAILDVGLKIEGILPFASAEDLREKLKPGDRLMVSVKGRGPDGYYELTRLKIAQPRDWSALEQAFTSGATIMGTVTGAVKGGLTVDVGMRAFLPASRSGTRDASELEKLVGQEIACRITQLDIPDENVILDRRIILEEQARSAAERRYSELQEGQTVHGTVRSLASYGAFIDIGGIDGLLHVSDLSWARVENPADLLAPGQEIEVKVLKIDPEKQRISLGLKQLQPEPWESARGKYKAGDRVRGTVTRLADFGAFVELEPGIEGLIHISEMSWTKRVRKAGDLLKPGDAVEVVVLKVEPEAKRLSLGLKQALGDPWVEAMQRIHVGSQIEGVVTRFTQFGAFVEVAEGVEGMVHISEIAADKRLHHPEEALKKGERVKALVLVIDAEKRQMRLSIKQLIPTSLDEYLREHAPGDTVTGRIMDIHGSRARVELGEGVEAECTLPGDTGSASEPQSGKANISSLTAMLQAKWKGGNATPSRASAEQPRAGQIRNLRITAIDTDAKKISVELT